MIRLPRNGTSGARSLCWLLCAGGLSLSVPQPEGAISLGGLGQEWSGQWCRDDFWAAKSSVIALLPVSSEAYALQQCVGWPAIGYGDMLPIPPCDQLYYMFLLGLTSSVTGHVLSHLSQALRTRKCSCITVGFLSHGARWPTFYCH